MAPAARFLWAFPWSPAAHDIRVPVIQVGGVPGQKNATRPSNIDHFDIKLLGHWLFFDAVHLADFVEPERVTCLKNQITTIIIAVTIGTHTHTHMYIHTHIYIYIYLIAIVAILHCSYD